MAAHKDIRKTTPGYTIIFRDSANVVVDPTTFEVIEVKIYNMATNTLIQQFRYPAATDYTTLVPTAADVPFTFDGTKTQEAESGENRIEVWTTKTGDITCITGVLNEFIDAKDA